MLKLENITRLHLNIHKLYNNVTVYHSFYQFIIQYISLTNKVGLDFVQCYDCQNSIHYTRKAYIVLSILITLITWNKYQREMS